MHVIDYYYLFIIILFFFFLFFFNLQKKIYCNIELLYSNFYFDNYTNHHEQNAVYLLLLIYRVSLIYILLYLCSGFIVDIEIFDMALFINNIFFFTKIIFYFFIFIFLFLLESYMKLVNWINFEIIILFSICTFALTLILNSKDFLNFYLSLEIYSLSICGIMGLRRAMKNFVEATFKYFIINSVSSCFILFGVSIIYIFTGTFEYEDLKLFLWNTELHINYFFVDIGVIFFLIGFFVKLSLFPFNYWIIDVYENTSIPLTFFLIIFPKFIFVTFFNIIILNIFYSNTFYLSFIFYLSLLSFVINNIIALYQVKIKKLLICSSLANIPFFLMPIYIKTFFSFISFYSFFIIYFFNLFAVFIFIFFLYNWMGNKNFFFKKITSLTGFVKNNKFMSYILLTLLLSLAGLPPFFGFFAKFYFLNLFMLNNLLYLILLFSFVNLLTVFYYLRLVKLIFQNKHYQPKLLIIKSFGLILIFVFIFLLNIFSILYFELLFNYITVFFLNSEWVYII